MSVTIDESEGRTIPEDLNLDKSCFWKDICFYYKHSLSTMHNKYE